MGAQQSNLTAFGGAMNTDLAALVVPMNRHAVAAATELDQVRAVYGDACVEHVKRFINASPLPWHRALPAAVESWERENGRGRWDPEFHPNI